MTHIEAAQALLNAWAKATNAGDANGIASLCTDDAGMITRLGVVLHGRKAIEQGHVQTFSRIHFSTGIPEVLHLQRVSDDAFVIYVRAIVTASGAVKGTLNNLYTLLCVHCDSGWRIASMTNTGIA